MAPLVSLTDLKKYTRVETTADDATLAPIVTGAIAAIQAWCQRPLGVETWTFEDDAATNRVYGRVTTLVIPVTPVDPTTVVITDADGVRVAPATYRVRKDGRVEAKAGASFGNGPYTITADVGLGLRDDYEAVVKPVLFDCILDLASVRSQNRNPDASVVQSVGVMSVQTTNADIPARVTSRLAPFRQQGTW